VVICTGVSAAAIVRLSDCVAVCAVESLTWIVKVLVLTWVGVPEMRPAASRVNPTGRLPDFRDQV
jgi:hypothetical protein